MDRLRGPLAALILCWFPGHAFGAPAGAAPGASSGDAVPFDPKDYPRKAVSQLLAAEPCGEGRTGLRDVLFSSELVYQGAVRAPASARHRLLGEWAKSIGDPGAEARYKEEVSLVEGGRVRWIAAPEKLLALMQMDLQPGDRALLYLVFVGCSAKEPLFAVDDFEQTDQREDEAEDLLI